MNSDLLAHLHSQADSLPTYDELRSAPRRSLPAGVQLDLRLPDGRNYTVPVLNVSDEGVRVMCGDPLTCGQRVELRCEMDDPSMPVETFEIMHVRSNTNGYEIGLVLVD